MLRVIIDPGHGGKDPGGGSNDLWLEKDKVLEISLYQYKNLKELGFEVELTRDKDIYINSTERTRIVRNSKADICISNHINAYNGQAEGAETIRSIHSDGKLANMIMDELVTAGAKKRRVFSKCGEKDPSKDYYFMHRQTGEVQTVIIEYGFADNAVDAKRIQENWKEYAESVVKALCQYTNIPYKEPSQEDYIKINLHGKDMQVEGLFKDGINYVPIRFLEQLGYKIGWDNDTDTILIDYKGEDE